jgi:hypothetical protein
MPANCSNALDVLNLIDSLNEMMRANLIFMLFLLMIQKMDFLDNIYTSLIIGVLIILNGGIERSEA